MDQSASLPAAPAHEMREPLLVISSAAPVRERVRVHVRASDYRRGRVHEGRLWMPHLCRISSVCALILRILISASHTKRTAIFGYANYRHLGLSPRPAPWRATLASESSSSFLPLNFFLLFLKTSDDESDAPQVVG